MRLAGDAGTGPEDDFGRDHDGNVPHAPDAFEVTSAALAGASFDSAEPFHAAAGIPAEDNCGCDEAGDDGRPTPKRNEPPSQSISEPVLAAAVGSLTQVALQMDDPVQALEDGIDALAEVLAEREIAVREEKAAARYLEQRRATAVAEIGNAYRHARLHRVGELIDVGYSLDQAVAITNADESEVRRRALVGGRDPDQVIYEYAIRHGYRPVQGSVASGRSVPQSRAPAPVRPASMIERLATMSEREFAEATAGPRWEQLHRHG